MNEIGLANVPALFDEESIWADPNWNLRRFTNGASKARRAIYSMNVLQVCFCPVVPRTRCLSDMFLGSQSTRNGVATQDIVDQCVDFQLQYLPPEASSIIAYIPVGSTANPSQIFNMRLTTQEVVFLSEAFWVEHPAFFEHIKNKPWTILPIEVNGHVTVVIIHSRHVQVPNGSPEGVVEINNIVVAHALREAGLERFIYGRLAYILLRSRGFRYRCDQPVDFWFSSEGCDRYNAGLRVYEIIRIMITRISQSVSERDLRGGFDSGVIWRGLSGTFVQTILHSALECPTSGGSHPRKPC